MKSFLIEFDLSSDQVSAHQNVVKSHANFYGIAVLIATLTLFTHFLHKASDQKCSTINLMIEAFVPIANGFSGFVLY